MTVVPAKGHRHGNRERELMGTFGTVTIAVPRARLSTSDGKTTEWQNKTLAEVRRRPPLTIFQPIPRRHPLCRGEQHPLPH